MITYESKQLKPHECNYPSYDLNFMAMIFTLKIWQHYLFGKTFEIYTDHKSLKYVFFTEGVEHETECWTDLLNDYDCKIIYHLSRENIVVDALSQKESVVFAQTMASSWKLVDAMQAIRLNHYGNGAYLAHIHVLPDLSMKIWEAQSTNQEITKNLSKFTSDVFPDFRLTDDGLCRFWDRI